MTAVSEPSATAAFDPLSELVGLVAGPIAAGIRSVDQVRRAADELLRGVENFNATMQTLNETASRLNRLLDDIEPPIRAAMPQVTRTVRTADELSQRLGSLPFDVAEFMVSMMDLSRRLAPLATFAESAGGMFGLRIPGFGRQAQPAPAPPPEPTQWAPAVTDAAEEAPAPAPKRSTAKRAAPTAKRSTTKQQARARRAPTKRSAAKQR